MPTNPREDNLPEPRYALRRRRLLGAAGVGLSAAIAGCGSSDDDGGDGSTSDDSETDDTDGSDGDDTSSNGSDDGQDGTEDDGQDSTEDDEEDEDVEPASFEVVAVDHPEEVDVGETHTFSFTVENAGGEDGTFEELLEFSIEGTDQWENVGRIELDVPAGETATWESNPTDFDDPATLQFRLGDTEWSYDVTITAPDPQAFAGSGEEVREDVTIEGGLTVVEATHSGESNFQVTLAGGEYDELFVNAIGDFDGTQAELVESGEYILDVTADGSWEVELRQPRSGQGDSLPASFSGSGPDVVGPVRFGGTGIAAGEHDGESNFQVQIYPMTGSFGESVFNEIGSFSGETTYSFEGIGWIDINADGNWTMEFE